MTKTNLNYKSVAAINRQAQALRVAATAEQAEAERMGKTDAGWSAAASASNLRAEAQRLEEQVNCLQQDLEDANDTAFEQAMAAIERMAEVSGCSILDAAQCVLDSIDGILAAGETDPPMHAGLIAGFDNQ